MSVRVNACVNVCVCVCVCVQECFFVLEFLQSVQGLQLETACFWWIIVIICQFYCDLVEYVAIFTVTNLARRPQSKMLEQPEGSLYLIARGIEIPPGQVFLALDQSKPATRRYKLICQLISSYLDISTEANCLSSRCVEFGQAFHMPSWGTKQMTAAISSFRLLGQRLLHVNSQLVG